MHIALVPVALLVSCSVALAACADENGNTTTSTPTGQSPSGSPGAGAAAPQDDLKATVTLTTQADGLQIGDLKTGTGASVQPHQTVTVQYTGWLPDGTVFDTSRKAGRNPVSFGLDGVIKGWTEGVVGMKVGGKRRLVIPGPLAYGTNPPPTSNIPPNATLTFDIELVSIT